MTACGAAEDEALRVLPVYRRINDDLWKENEKGNITKSELKAERWRRLGEECGLPASLLEGAAPLYSRFLSEPGRPSARVRQNCFKPLPKGEKGCFS